MTSQQRTTRSTGGPDFSTKSSSRSTEVAQRTTNAMTGRRSHWLNGIRIETTPIVIIEGVSAGRSEWARHLSFLIWIETPCQERLRRAVERDGIGALDDWESWMGDEDAHYERDPTLEHADV